MKTLLHCVAITALLAPVAGGSAQEAAAAAPATTSQSVDPGVAAERIMRALRDADGVPAGDVVVSTHAETVVLTGEVGSDVEAARTLAVAEEAAAGVRVSSEISVRPGVQQAAQQQAAQLVRSVEQALRDDERTANLGVAVSVDEAHVIGLHGLVPSRDSRRIAEDVAGRAAGATRIRSHLVVPAD